MTAAQVSRWESGRRQIKGEQLALFLDCVKANDVLRLAALDVRPGTQRE